MKLLVLNGPNLNMLGMREPAIYGTGSYEELLRYIQAAADRHGVTVEVVQSNHEGVLIDRIQQAYGEVDGLIFNPAGYTHTSVALLDALLAVGLPCVEVHLSNPEKREEFRKISRIRPACLTDFSGLGFEGYEKAIAFLKRILSEQ